MKARYITFYCFLLICIPFISFSQTSITNKDFDVTNDVAKIESFHYSSTQNLEYTSTSTFQNGLIQKSLNDGAIFIIAGNTNNNYTYSNFNKEFKINNNEYLIFEFAGIKFSCIKEGYKIIKQSSNNLVIEYKIGGKLIQVQYNLLKNNLIEETAPDLWFEIKTYYNKQGQLVRKLKNKSTNLQKEEKYYYATNGLLEKIEIENFIDHLKTEKHYEYELDEKGNWIKRIEYEIIPNEYDKKSFSTRKLTYSNGKVTGGYLDYYNDNFFTLNPVYFALLHPDDKVKDCISGDCQNGFGKKTFNEKDVYEGDFSIGLMSGKGTYTYGNGDKYEGDFKSGYINGQGKFTFATGDLYEGSFLMNQRSGFGTYTFKNGNKYAGNWIKGLQDGEGTLYDYKANLKQIAIYKEGKIIEVKSTTKIKELVTNNNSNETIKGTCIKGDCENGVGKITYLNTDIYQGTFVDGIRQGQGVYEYENKDKYYGNFSNNNPNGTGLYLFNSGDVYEGNYKDGQRQGFGTYMHKNGDYHYGNWINGKLDGEVTYYEFKTKKQYSLKYNNGTLTQTVNSKDLSYKTETDCVVGDCQTGFSILIQEDNNYNIYMFIANFKNGLPQGFGKAYVNNLLAYEGEFNNGKYNGKGTIYAGTNNEKKTIGGFKDGLLHDYCMSYISEKILSEGNYVNGVKNGEVIIYAPEHNIKRHELYSNDKLVKIIKTTEINPTSKSIPSGIVWKKNEDNSLFWLFNNKVEVTGNFFYVDTNLYVFNSDTKEIYELENFKAQKKDTYFYGKLLPHKFPHGAWIKRNATGLIAINSKGEIIKSNSVFKFAPGGGGIIYKGTNETDTLLFKNFSNAELNKLYPAEIYNETNEKTTTEVLKKTSTNSFQAVIDACKLGENASFCIFAKFKENQTELKQSGTNNTTFEQQTIASLNAIGRYDVGLLFNVFFKSDKELNKFASKLDSDVKLKLKAYAQKLRDDYAKTHDNHIPESLKNSVRKQ